MTSSTRSIGTLWIGAVLATLALLDVAGCTGDGGNGSDAGRIEGGLCNADGDCDDGLYCTGVERCTASRCAAGVPPCMGLCTEATRTCAGCATLDADGDGEPSIACGGADCDDADARRVPGRAEICDTTDHDEDCDPSTFGVRDGDGDGVADAECCNVDELGARRCGSDCDDTSAMARPGVLEVCNMRDDDCDSAVDEMAEVLLHRDGDGDLFGDPALSMMGCADMVSGYVVDGTDCDDATASIHPGAPESCASPADDDCDAEVDEGCICTAGMTRACMALGICAAGAETCDSGTVWAACSIGPELFEICDDEDDDCDGLTDEGLRGDCYVDGDRDGYAPVGATAMNVCLVGAACPADTTVRSPATGTPDCDDTDISRAPSEVEVCNSRRVDEDCDGTVDEGVSVLCYADGDNDTFALAGATATRLCPDPARAAVGFCAIGFTNREPLGASSSDCCDSEARAFPGQTSWFAGASTCGGYDFNCDGVATSRWTRQDASGCMSATSSSACNAADTAFTLAPVWVTAPPDCGLSGNLLDRCFWTSVPFVGGVCAPTPRAQPQECH